MAILEAEQPAVELTRQEKDLQILARFRLMDDDFMTMVFDGDHGATALLLNIILGRKDMRVHQVTAQREYKNPNPNGRSIKLDIYAEDNAGKAYDIEVQRDDRGAGAKRARFHSSMMDARLLRAGEDFSELADSYVIFITENDVIGTGSSLYHIDRRIEENGASFDDGSHIIYVNGSYQNNQDPVGKLMHDFRCTKADDMYYSVLAEKVRYFKESEGGRDTVCRMMEDMRNEVAAAANRETARRLLDIGKMSCEEIAEATQLTVEEVKELASHKSA